MQQPRLITQNTHVVFAAKELAKIQSIATTGSIRYTNTVQTCKFSERIQISNAEEAEIRLILCNRNWIISK